MPESFLLDWLQQLDLSFLGDFSELDWTSIATYGALLVAVSGAIWTSSKNIIKLLWRKTEGFLGFVISTVVIFSLWYSLLRVHVSISFNLDKEIFDNCLWISAVLFTPYYLVHYGLLKGFTLMIVRSIELILDLLVFSWFPQKAEQNRTKWRARLKWAYTSCKGSVDNFWQMGLKTILDSKIPLGLATSRQLESTSVNKENL